MADPIIQRLCAAARHRGHGNTSPAYAYLRKNYRALKRPLGVAHPPFRAIAEEMNAAGVRGGRQALLTEQTVARIWKRVCRDVEDDAKARAPRRVMPPPGWKPTPVVVPAGPVRLRENPNCVGGGDAAADQIARLRADMKARSGQ